MKMLYYIIYQHTVIIPVKKLKLILAFLQFLVCVHFGVWLSKHRYWVID